MKMSKFVIVDNVKKTCKSAKKFYRKNIIN